MQSNEIPNWQWGIVTLCDNTAMAGYLHIEQDNSAHAMLEIDVPAVGAWPANTAAVDPGFIRNVKPCSRADVTTFIQAHGWPAGGKVSPLIRRAIDAELRPQGAD